jgi:hypothetical protein
MNSRKTHNDERQNTTMDSRKIQNDDRQKTTMNSRKTHNDDRQNTTMDNRKIIILFSFDAFDLYPTYRKEGANGTEGYVIL